MASVGAVQHSLIGFSFQLPYSIMTGIQASPAPIVPIERNSKDTYSKQQLHSFRLHSLCLLCSGSLMRRLSMATDDTIRPLYTIVLYTKSIQLLDRWKPSRARIEEVRPKSPQKAQTQKWITSQLTQQPSRLRLVDDFGLKPCIASYILVAYQSYNSGHLLI